MLAVLIEKVIGKLAPLQVVLHVLTLLEECLELSLEQEQEPYFWKLALAG